MNRPSSCLFPFCERLEIKTNAQVIFDGTVLRHGKYVSRVRLILELKACCVRPTKIIYDFKMRILTSMLADSFFVTLFRSLCLRAMNAFCLSPLLCFRHCEL